MFNKQQKNGKWLSLHLAQQVKWFALVAVALLLSLSQNPRVALADTCTASGFGAVWSAITWSCGHVPLATDTVVIPAGIFPRTLDTDATIAGLTIDNGAALFELNGHTLTVNGNVVNNSADGIGTAASGTLNIKGSSCSTKATLTGNGGLFAAPGPFTINVTNVDTSGFTGGLSGISTGPVTVSGTGTAQTGTTRTAPKTLTYNITACAKSAAVGGVAERISLTTAQQAQLWLREWGFIAMSVVLIVSGVGLWLARKR